MTPDERDRLVRLEEQVKNQREDFEEIKRALNDVLKEVHQMRVALSTAASFTKGGWWAFTKIAAVIAGLVGLITSVADHWPFR